MTSDHDAGAGLHGPRAWLLSAILGLLMGALLTQVLPARYEAAPAIVEHGAAEAGAPAHEDAHGPSPVIPLWLCAPFALLLGSIALMPFISARVWHRHFPDFAFFLGAVAVGYYLVGFARPGYAGGLSYGQYRVLHSGLEYYSFIALVGGLFLVSGGILVDVRGRGGPAANTLLLAFGAVIANLVGTTGASMLLIRPFMRMNKGRLSPIHIVMFIFIVSNCGGCLTPVGDPPLYLGYLKGVPFFWTLENLWASWLLTVGALLGVFFLIDTLAERRRRPRPVEAPYHDAPHAGRGVRVRGAVGLVGLALMIFGVFVDPILHAAAGIEGVPVGATFQIAVAAGAYALSPRGIYRANEFTFFPVKEVGLLFLGIFATMTPALGYLSAHGHALGLRSPTAFYYGTGMLSAVLDNAPTYLNFLQIAFGNPEVNALAAVGNTEVDPRTIAAFIDTERGREVLASVSTGAVFFGAMTYIGNGPNFMVKAIADASGVRMPSFFGYVLRALVILAPVLALHWLVFIA